MQIDNIDLILRVASAALAGTAVGMERELRGHPAGLRTHALVSIGAAVFTVAGTVDWGIENVVSDPTRLAAQVVSGIGFIGAGAILRDGTGVKGLTTATTIWVAGAMGVMFGTGNYVIAVGSTAIVLAALIMLRWLAKPLTKHGRSTSTVDVEYEIGHGTIGPIIRSIQDRDANIDGIVVEDTAHADSADLRRVQLSVSSRTSAVDTLFESLSIELQSRPEVRKVRITAP